MPLEIRNHTDGKIIHRNNLVPGDADHPDLREAAMETALPQGQLQLQQWVFEGIRISYTSLSLQDQLVTDWQSDLEAMTLFFNLGGRASIRSSQPGEEKTNRSFEQLEHNLFYQHGFHGAMEYAGKDCRHLLIQFSPKAFQRLASEAPETLALFRPAIRKKQSEAFPMRNASLDFRMSMAIHDIVYPVVEGPSRKLHLQAKCMELIALQAESFRRAALAKPQYCKTEYDRERLLFARDYLLQHYDLPPSLQELSRIAGINVFKLKNGFREVFGDSVFSYLNQYKMEMARAEILKGEKSVGELAFDLGYSSLQHFSAAFRKKFGVAPSALRRP